MNSSVSATALVCFAVLNCAGLAQPTATNSVKISGRIVDANGPMSVVVRMTRIVGHDLVDEKTVISSRDGRFTFLGVPGNKYRIYLPEYLVRIQKTVDTASGKDVELGDLAFERCGDVYFGTPPKAPTSPPSHGDLKVGQILIEPQNLAQDQWNIVDAPQSPTALADLNGLAELPPCWPGPSLDKRPEWEAMCSIDLDRYVSVESLVGGKVKSIRVVRHDPNLIRLWPAVQ